MTSSTLSAACAAATFVAVWLALGVPGRWVRGRLAVVGRAFRALVERAGALLPEHAAKEVALGDLSEMADIVRLGMSAGLSFDAALDLYCAGRDCPLAAELSRARLLWQVGVETRAGALDAAARRLGVPALKSFGAVVSQSIEFGAPVSEALGELAREARERHRAEVERRIERAPVKILVPTGTLVLPALLLSILGPLLAVGGMF